MSSSDGCHDDCDNESTASGNVVTRGFETNICRGHNQVYKILQYWWWTLRKTRHDQIVSAVGYDHLFTNRNDNQQLQNNHLMSIRTQHTLKLTKGELKRKWTNTASTYICVCTYFKTVLSGSPVTTAWRVLRLRMEKTASRYGG
jgi:hypothetical protein